LGAFPALRAGNRAFRLYLFLPAAKKGYRFNPLRVLVLKGDTAAAKRFPAMPLSPQVFGVFLDKPLFFNFYGLYL
jgi:hypothetical protein